MVRVLVTGGAGYIGSACVKTLLDEGYEVVVADNLSKGRKELVDSRASFHEVDLASGDLDPLFSQVVDAVIHFAAYKAVEESMEDVPKYSDNVTGTVRLLNAMVRHGVKRLVFSSTAAVYGNPEYVPVDEGHPVRPESFYGETKHVLERLLRWYGRVHGVTYVALRYFNVVGDVLGYQDPEAKNVLPILIEVLNGKRDVFTLFGDSYDTRDGTCVRDYIDVKDLVQAHLSALSLDSSAVINLGTSEGVTVKELVKVVETVTGKKVPLSVTEPRKGDPASVVASNEKAKKLLGWTPEVPLEESVRSTYDAYR
ncbi:UDP-glucose 4-epimerase GalE [Candidatus Woesearchaeota archaeon]|nr:UDP-glucose 4-epimerase GalE [Candidatus Woesearchaeota archaeon]